MAAASATEHAVARLEPGDAFSTTPADSMPITSGGSTPT
jgi:hypothetical protein